MHTRRPLALLSALVLAAACHRGALGSTSTVSTVLQDQNGQRVGEASLTERGGEVRIDARVTGMTPGEHGIHFHAVGNCASTSGPFTAAGGHFNAAGKAHGLQNPNGAHNGDLPNLVVGADGTGRLQASTNRITLTAGPSSIYDADGTALVVHAARDDQMTDPSGNSGARVACGVLAQPK